MEVKAYIRNLRIAPRKVRLVIGLIRGMKVNDALAQLKFMRKQAALPMTKLIRSAMANAEHNFKLDPDDLYIKKIVADGGQVLDRWRARAFGRAAPIRKRMSHVSLILEEIPKKEEAEKRRSGEAEKNEAKKEDRKEAPKAEKKVVKKIVRKAAKKADKE